MLDFVFHVAMPAMSCYLIVMALVYLLGALVAFLSELFNRSQ